MIRTAASIALVVLIAWVAIRLVFGFAGGLLALLLSLLVFWLLTVFSPETAKKMRDTFRGESL